MNMDNIVRHASTLYLLSYFGGIVIVSLLEYIVPRRAAGDTLRLRWFGNISVAIISGTVARLVLPTVGISLALLCAQYGWGLFNRVAIPLWGEIILTLIIVDLVIYCQHYLLHHVPLLWRIHRLHHTDQNFDFTTGFRFHPLEAIMTTAINSAVIVVLGPAPIAVLISQLALIAESIGGHANVCMPP